MPIIKYSNVTQFDEFGMTVKLNFDAPLNVSTGLSPDSLRITILEPKIF